jgi:hypothetical protein
MKIKLMIFMLMLSSLPALAGTYHVGTYTNCIEMVDAFAGITRWFNCHTGGAYIADSCDQAYDILRSSQNCCDSQNGMRQSTVKIACTEIK